MRGVAIALSVGGALLIGGAFAATALNRYIYLSGININMKAWLVGAFLVVAAVVLGLMGMRINGARHRRSK